MCRGVFIMKGLPPETTGRIFLAVSCWMAACVCFWKASLASHLHGSSTTSTFTSLTGDSKRSHDERGPRTAAATLRFLAKLLLNERTRMDSAAAAKRFKSLNSKAEFNLPRLFGGWLRCCEAAVWKPSGAFSFHSYTLAHERHR